MSEQEPKWQQNADVILQARIAEMKAQAIAARDAAVKDAEKQIEALTKMLQAHLRMQGKQLNG